MRSAPETVEIRAERFVGKMMALIGIEAPLTTGEQRLLRECVDRAVEDNGGAPPGSLQRLLCNAIDREIRSLGVLGVIDGGKAE